MVEPTHLKNISQIWSFPQVRLKIQSSWNHHLGKLTARTEKSPNWEGKSSEPNLHDFGFHVNLHRCTVEVPLEHQNILSTWVWVREGILKKNTCCGQIFSIAKPGGKWFELKNQIACSVVKVNYRPRQKHLIVLVLCVFFDNNTYDLGIKIGDRKSWTYHNQQQSFDGMLTNRDFPPFLWPN